MKADKLKKGMTYEQVLQILGCEPAESETITYGNGVVAKLYRWQAGKDQISASFRDGRLSEIGGVINDWVEWLTVRRAAIFQHRYREALFWHCEEEVRQRKPQADDCSGLGRR